MKRDKPKVLGDHKRTGTTFVPPLKSLPGGMQEISYVLRILPEILWLDLLNEALGLRAGIALAHEFNRVLLASAPDEPYRNYALATMLGRVSENQRAETIAKLVEKGVREQLASAIAPLAVLFPEFPARWVVASPVHCENPLGKLGDAVRRLLDKTSRPASIAQATALSLRVSSGHMIFSEKVPRPDLDAIITAPDSDDGRRAASMVRMALLMEVGTTALDEAWSRSFWNRCYRLESCILTS